MFCFFWTWIGPKKNYKIRKLWLCCCTLLKIIFFRTSRTIKFLIFNFFQNHIHSSRLELIEKCDKVHHFHTKCLQISECKQVKPSLILYFKRHKEICEILKKSYETSPLTKFKRSFEGLNVSPQFAKLYNFKNYFLESKQNDL